MVGTSVLAEALGEVSEAFGVEFGRFEFGFVLVVILVVGVLGS